MLDLRWIDHVGSIDKGIELVNKLYWNVSVTEGFGKFFVKSGEKVIFAADNSEAADAFLYGLSLAYGVLPPHLLGLLEQGMQELLE